MKNTVRVGKIKIQILEYFVPAGPLPDYPLSLCRGFVRTLLREG